MLREDNNKINSKVVPAYKMFTNIVNHNHKDTNKALSLSTCQWYFISYGAGSRAAQHSSATQDKKWGSVDANGLHLKMVTKHLLKHTCTIQTQSAILNQPELYFLLNS